MNNNNGTTKYRIEQLEKRVGNIKDEVYQIRTNELPHIQNAIVELKTRFDTYEKSLERRFDAFNDSFKLFVKIMIAINVGALIAFVIIERLV